MLFYRNKIDQRKPKGGGSGNPPASPTSHKTTNIKTSHRTLSLNRDYSHCAGKAQCASHPGMHTPYFLQTLTRSHEKVLTCGIFLTLNLWGLLDNNQFSNTKWVSHNSILTPLRVNTVLTSLRLRKTTLSLLEMPAQNVCLL